MVLSAAHHDLPASAVQMFREEVTLDRDGDTHMCSGDSRIKGHLKAGDMDGCFHFESMILNH